MAVSEQRELISKKQKAADLKRRVVAIRPTPQRFIDRLRVWTEMNRLFSKS
jgi:hypothetical protein